MILVSVKRLVRIFELRGKLKRLDKVYCSILRQPISDKLKDKKLGVIDDEMSKIQKEIDCL